MSAIVRQVPLGEGLLADISGQETWHEVSTTSLGAAQTRSRVWFDGVADTSRYHRPMGAPDQTVHQLKAWFDGDLDALDRLLRENLDWMQLYARRELDPALRRRVDSVDLVQEGVARILARGPRYAPRSREEFRALLARVLQGAVGDQRDRERAAKRDVRKDRNLPSQGLSRFAPEGHVGGRPESALEREERHEEVHRALARLAPEDAEVLRLRQFEDLSFAEVAERMGLESPDTARMRFHRALPRLARALDEAGDVPGA